MLKSELTKRQIFILQVINSLEKAVNQEILERLSEDFELTSRITVVRDLNILVKKKLIKKTGKGRGVYYSASVPFLNMSFDINQYFAIEPDKREIKENKNVFKNKMIWKDIFSSSEIKHIAKLTENFKKHFNEYNSTQIKKEFERITIEFSWKSSSIEGNTYTLLDTERLIKEKKEVPGKDHSEAVMILNHKKALEYVWAHPKEFQKISPRKIEELHFLISADLGIKKGIRKRGVGIVGTAYKPFDNVFQIRESLEDLCGLVNELKDPFAKALVAVLGISFIQPFEDGNKRTSRLVGNALLVANNFCPISYRSADEIEYKKAVILFYEKQSLAFFKKMFIEQYTFAVGNYFQ
jgi:Fe2+ or Zn2+ uptake regulation protein